MVQFAKLVNRVIRDDASIMEMRRPSCYIFLNKTIVLNSRYRSRLSSTIVLAHEYGHHIDNRVNKTEFRMGNIRAIALNNGDPMLYNKAIFAMEKEAWRVGYDVLQAQGFFQSSKNYAAFLDMREAALDTYEYLVKPLDLWEKLHRSVRSEYTQMRLW